MAWSIFASKDSNLSNSSKDLKRFNVPEDGRLIRAAANELHEQGWTVNGIYETDEDGLPVASSEPEPKRRGGYRR